MFSPAQLNLLVLSSLYLEHRFVFSLARLTLLLLLRRGRLSRSSVSNQFYLYLHFFEMAITSKYAFVCLKTMRQLHGAVLRPILTAQWQPLRLDLVCFNKYIFRTHMT